MEYMPFLGVLAFFVLAIILIPNPFSMRVRKEIEYIRMRKHFFLYGIGGYRDKKVLLSRLQMEQSRISQRVGLIKCKLLDIANNDNMAPWYLKEEIRSVYIEAGRIVDEYEMIKRWNKIFKDEKE